MMLYRQRIRIQHLHQAQYRFDALQPQFTNDLRAFHNGRRRWTTQVRFGQLNHPLGHAPSQYPNNNYPDPSTPSSPHSTHTTTQTSILQPDINEPTPTANQHPKQQNPTTPQSFHSPRCY